MIKLKIKNWLQKDKDYEEEIKINGVTYYNVNEYSEENVDINAYDEEKWRDGKIYEFRCLKDIQNFINTCDIDFTEECIRKFSDYDWYEMDFNLTIDTSEDNLLCFDISMHPEWRD